MTPESTLAQRDRLAALVANLLGIIRRAGGFMKPEDQRQYREAQAELAEMEGKR
jgi:hypothetical protein